MRENIINVLPIFLRYDVLDAVNRNNEEKDKY